MASNKARSLPLWAEPNYVGGCSSRRPAKGEFRDQTFSTPKVGCTSSMGTRGDVLGGTHHDPRHAGAKSALSRRSGPVPRPPVGGANGDAFGGFRLGPAVRRSVARKYQRVRTLAVDHGKLDLDVERRGADALPHAGFCSPPADCHIDLSQVGRLKMAGSLSPAQKSFSSPAHRTRIGHSPEPSSMDKTVAELNIEHYRKLLASPDLDETKRRTVESLLAAEEAKLAQIKAERAAAMISSKRK